jgi:N-acetyl-anhydromuramyl-L-alanine amidase AmpD
MRWFLSITMALGFTLAAAAPALAEAPPYYPPIEWIPASRSNYDLGRWAPVTAIVIHETDGPWTSAVNWFRNSRSRVSAHYIVRAWDGGIVQMVAESDTAYHARNANPWSIGIELEYSVRFGIPHTAAQYRTAAQLTCAIARRYGIPLDRAHIVGHKELPDANHGDPGPTWNWNNFMSLVRGCSVQRAQAVARSLRTVGDHGFVPTAGLSFGGVSDEVALLQWNLTYLGFMDADEVSGGGSRFGPLTQAAVTAFQESAGIPATGLYDEVTATALVHAITAKPADVPAKDLNAETESEDVATLQAALQQLGYMDLVTGYYGAITMEALAKFQEDNGIEPTGAYGAITRMALAFRTKPSVASEESPPIELAIGGLGSTAVFLIP